MTFLRVDLRLWLRRSGFFLLFLVLLYAVGRPVQMWLDGFYSGDRAPYLQMPSPTAMSIRWQSPEKYAGVVRYGTRANHLDLIQKEAAQSEEHEVRLSGLKPATRYFYSAGDEDSTIYKGSQFWFRTSPEVGIKTGAPVAVRLWVTGDQGYPNVIQRQVRDAAQNWLKKNPRQQPNATGFDLWLTTGDNAYPSGTNPQFQAGFFQPYKDILRNTPVWPVYGNHDSRRWVFFNIFSFPAQAESGGVASGTEHYYSFDYANVHVVMLDTEESSLEVDGEMLTWLEQDLQKTKQQWLLAFLHYPPYTKGSHNSDNRLDSGGRLLTVRENILPVLEKAGVDLVLSGHSHLYERSQLINCHYGLSSTFNKSFIRSDSQQSVYIKQDKLLAANNGTVYNVLGSSSKLNDGPLNHPAMPYSLHESGSNVIDINGNNLKSYFINKQGQVKDQFEIRKGVDGGSKSRSCH